MQPLTNEIYAALKENECRRSELVLIDGHHRVVNGSHRIPTRKISILNDY